MLRFISFLFGGPLNRVLSVLEKRVDATTDRERLKAEIIKTHYETRPDFMHAGGFVLMMLFAVPLAGWFGAVCLYSILWCADCIFPQTWTIAALPPPLDQWAGAIVMAIFGIAGLPFLRRR